MNPQAFPSQKRVYRGGYPTDEFVPMNGMSLRDYFAAKAMQGMLSNFRWMQEAATEHADINGCDLVPLMAYEVADAMLKAREA